MLDNNINVVRYVMHIQKCLDSKKGNWFDPKKPVSSGKER